MAGDPSTDRPIIMDCEWRRSFTHRFWQQNRSGILKGYVLTLLIAVAYTQMLSRTQNQVVEQRLEIAIGCAISLIAPLYMGIYLVGKVRDHARSLAQLRSVAEVTVSWASVCGSLWFVALWIYTKLTPPAWDVFTGSGILVLALMIGQINWGFLSWMLFSNRGEKSIWKFRVPCFLIMFILGLVSWCAGLVFSHNPVATWPVVLLVVSIVSVLGVFSRILFASYCNGSIPMALVALGNGLIPSTSLGDEDS
jgi:hypothetical protein